ncbi:MAG TPA: sigma-70 family RNA polymerase sigma factor [Solirubrobacteraceae bacterium]|jgi:RNA polymerase sigma factor (sigma-70 family)|nr:sigma-70 family RNA polymerase sigma factor [Solirubrobacteraceae bacterium]
MALDAATGVSLFPARSYSAPDRRRRRRRRALVQAERELVEAAQRGGIRERQQLIQDFRPLIASTARGYRHSPGISESELMQEGCVGLLQALSHYNPSLGVPFGAYARWWVSRAVQQLVSELSGPVVLSDRAVRLLMRIKRARHDYEQAQGRGPRASELADACGLPSAQVESLIAADHDARSLSGPDPEDDGEGPSGGEALVDPRGEDAYESAIWRLAAAQVPRMLDHVNERERRVIRARYGLDGPERTLGELARELSVSAERVRQIEQAALRKLSAVCDGAHAPARCG